MNEFEMNKWAEIIAEENKKNPPIEVDEKLDRRDVINRNADNIVIFIRKKRGK